MPNDVAGGGGQSSRYEVPSDVKDAFATIAKYIAAKSPKLGNLESAINDVIRQDGDNPDITGLAALALAALGASVANIAANEKSRNPELAREELKQELRAIDEKYKPRIELQAELREINAKHGLGAPDAGSINAKASEARRAQIASWQLKQECRDIDAKYRINQLAQELRKYSSVIGKLRDAIGQIDRHYPPGTEEARKLSSEMLRDVYNIYNDISDLREKIREIAAARATYPPHEVLESGVWWHGFPGSDGTSLQTLLDDAVYVAEMPHVERHATDTSDGAATAREELWAELRAIDREYAPKICLQYAGAAAADAVELHSELCRRLGGDHKTVKAVGACCNLARTLVDFCDATQEFATLEQQEIDVGLDTHAAALADQAMLRVVDTIFSLGECYRHLLINDRHALGVLVGMACAMTGADPSTFVADVSVSAAQQAQGAAL
ncbi:hypothetical protein [Anaplasma centrale]|nr:hypothetical protein [Anaplasma centrale]